MRMAARASGEAREEALACMRRLGVRAEGKVVRGWGLVNKGEAYLRGFEGFHAGGIQDQ